MKRGSVVRLSTFFYPIGPSVLLMGTPLESETKYNEDFENYTIYIFFSRKKDLF